MNPQAQYQLLRKLATGGMAEVFLANAAGPMGFEKKVVVKRILPHLAEDARFVEMFLGEARLAALLDHPNIVHVFDFGEVEGRYFLAMEYIDGLDLRTLLARAHARALPLSPALCARIVSLAADGLSYAHEFRHPETGQVVNIVHRDVTPDNLLVSRSGVVKVVDFGIAKAVGDQQTRTGRLRGKLAYMSPEQVRGLALDRRTDVYALGAVLYQLLSFARPFEQDHEALLMQAIVHEPHVPLVERRPDLPVELRKIVEKALSKSPDQRYPNARELHDALDAFVVDSGEPASAYHLSKLVEQFGDAEEPTAEGPTRLDRRPRPSVKTPSAEILVPSLKSPEVAVPAQVPVTDPQRAAPPRPPSRKGAVLAMVVVILLAGAIAMGVESSWMLRWLTLTPAESGQTPVFPLPGAGQEK